MSTEAALKTIFLFPLEHRIKILRQARAKAIISHGAKPPRLALRFWRMRMILLAVSCGCGLKGNHNEA